MWCGSPYRTGRNPYTFSAYLSDAITERRRPGRGALAARLAIRRPYDSTGLPPCSRIDQRTAARSRSSESMVSRSRIRGHYIHMARLGTSLAVVWYAALFVSPHRHGAFVADSTGRPGLWRIDRFATPAAPGHVPAIACAPHRTHRPATSAVVVAIRAA